MAEFALFGWRGVAAAALFAFGSGFLVAQQGSQPAVQAKAAADVTVIRTNVRRVVLDVVVTGKDGAPVRGLTRDDFTVVEDGKPQTLLSFDVHDFDATPAFVPPKVPPLGANAYLDLPKGPEKGPLYLILYDLVNIDPADQAYARSQLRKFIDSKPEGTRFAIIVFSDGMHMVQGFTSDKSALLAPLDPATNNPHVPQSFQLGANNGKGDGEMEASVFTALAHYLEGFPGRKNVIWVSGDFPLSLFANGDNTLVGDGQYTGKVKEIVDTLARDQVAIYPVNVRGAIVTEEFGPSGAAGADGGTVSDSRHPQESLGSSPQIAADLANGTLHDAGGPGFSETVGTNMAADGVAKATGGRAFYGTNDLATLLARATANGSNYYTLSYSPTNGDYNGKLRGIHVELEKQGYQLAYRRSYFGVNQNAKLEAGAKQGTELAGSQGSIPQDDPLSTDMRHGAPMEHDVVFLAQFHVVGAPAMGTPEQMARLVGDPGSLRRQNKPAKVAKPIPLQSYMVDYRVMDTQGKTHTAAAAGAPQATLQFVAVSFDADGNMLSGVIQNASRDASPGKTGANPSSLLRVQQQMDVPVKAAWIRVAVRDLSTDRVGALEVPLPLGKEGTDAAAGKPGPQVPGGQAVAQQ